MSWSVACVERGDENLRDPIGSWWVQVDMRMVSHTWGESLTQVYAEIRFHPHR